VPERIAVLCPTRDRLPGFRRAATSVINSSTLVDFIGYIDGDQHYTYFGPGPEKSWNDRVLFTVGDRIGPVAAANELARTHPGYDVYGLLTDDCTVTTPRWDEWVLEAVKQFPNRICVISPHHNMGNHVDMPFVTKEWIKAVGWYACPDCYHYSWPTITGLIGEMTAICHAPAHKFHVEHADHVQDHTAQTRDAQPFYEFVSLKLPAVVERLRQAMS
jgi:hypothetical protein